MRPDVFEVLRRAVAPRDFSPPSEWLERCVTLPPGYPSSDTGRFSFLRFPFWRAVVDLAARPERLEIVVLKCSQAGGTECVLQGALRWLCANRPAPFLWVGAQQEMIEAFWQKRILPGLTMAGKEMGELCGAWKTVGMRASAGNGASVTAVWSSSKAGVKSNSYSNVFADEVSTYDAFTVEKLRPRVENYPGGKLWIMSAMDKRKGGGTSDDPLWKEFLQTDRREWVMPDPGGGEDFRMDMGWRADKGESVAGVKWAREARREDGTWDLDLVERSAHYVTPTGAVVEESARPGLVAKGHWTPTAEGRPGAVGFRVPCFLLRHKSFGSVAVNFLRAKKAGVETLRTFVMEELAEEWHDEKITIGDTLVDGRRADYAQGTRMSEARDFAAPYVGLPKVVMVSGDVQKLSLYWLAREWVCTGSGKADSGLLDWAEVADWETFEQKTREVKAFRSWVDMRYKWRRGEVLEYAASAPYVVPCMGSDGRMKDLINDGTIDVREGRRGGGRRGNGIGYLVFDSWGITWHLFQLMLGREGYGAWRLPRNVEREYVRQVTAEEMVDGKAVERHKGADNHLLDCEKMQLVGVIWADILSPFRASFTLPENRGSLAKNRQLNLFDGHDGPGGGRTL